MRDDFIARLEAQIGGPRDSALLRFSLGSALRDRGDLAGAIASLRAALDFDANYSAAWSLLGRAQAESADAAGARASFERGIAAARERGDVQAEKMMRVFLRRLNPPGQV